MGLAAIAAAVIYMFVAWVLALVFFALFKTSVMFLRDVVGGFIENYALPFLLHPVEVLRDRGLARARRLLAQELQRMEHDDAHAQEGAQEPLDFEAEREQERQQRRAQLDNEADRLRKIVEERDYDGFQYVNDDARFVYLAREVVRLKGIVDGQAGPKSARKRD